MYREEDLVCLAKRENNAKRSYVVVNPLQGKHVPVEPHLALQMFEELSEAIQKAYPKEKLVLIGFAETATAIGAAVAVNLNMLSMQTTRENLGEVEYFYFSEEHSHAVEQKIVKSDLEEACEKVERVIFVEDEVTTGHTILNAISSIRKKILHEIQYTVASILNGMDQEALEAFEKEGVDCLYLVKTDHSRYDEVVAQYLDEEQVQTPENLSGLKAVEAGNYKRKNYCLQENIRRLIEGKSYQKVCQNLVAEAEEWISQGEKVLVLGTEEFMYPGLFLGNEIEKRGNQVCFHATTRSPIIPMKKEGYPLQERIRLRSVYDQERVTFLYNLGTYQRVFIVSDAVCENNPGLEDLIQALESRGNRNIMILEWRVK